MEGIGHRMVVFCLVDWHSGKEVNLRENLEAGWMGNGYPSTMKREEGVDPEPRFLSTVAGEWELYWASEQVGVARPCLL